MSQRKIEQKIRRRKTDISQLDIKINNINNWYTDAQVVEYKKERYKLRIDLYDLEGELCIYLL